MVNMYDLLFIFKMFNIFIVDVFEQFTISILFISLHNFSIENMVLVVTLSLIFWLSFYGGQLIYNNKYYLALVVTFKIIKINLHTKYHNDIFFISSLFLFFFLFNIIVTQNLTSMVPDVLT